MRPHVLDFSFSRPSPEDLLATDRDALTYVGNVRPPAEWLARCRELGVNVCFIFETTGNRAQEGYQAGVYDAQFSDARTDQIGYPREASVCYVVSDGNRFDPFSGGDRIAEYGRGIATTSLRPFFFYGNRYAVDHAIAGARSVVPSRLLAGPNGDGGWLPVPWGADPTRDLIGQESNIAPPIPGTDENSVYHDYAASSTPAQLRRSPDVPYVMSTPGQADVLVDGEIGEVYEVDGPGTLPIVPVSAERRAFIISDVRAKRIETLAALAGAGPGGITEARVKELIAAARISP